MLTLELRELQCHNTINTIMSQMRHPTCSVSSLLPAEDKLSRSNTPTRPICLPGQLPAVIATHTVYAIPLMKQYFMPCHVATEHHVLGKSDHSSSSAPCPQSSRQVRPLTHDKPPQFGVLQSAKATERPVCRLRLAHRFDPCFLVRWSSAQYLGWVQRETLRSR